MCFQKRQKFNKYTINLHKNKETKNVYCQERKTKQKEKEKKSQTDPRSWSILKKADYRTSRTSRHLNSWINSPQVLPKQHFKLLIFPSTFLPPLQNFTVFPSSISLVSIPAEKHPQPQFELKQKSYEGTQTHILFSLLCVWSRNITLES